MFEQWNIGVVIPAKNEEKHIKNVINTLPSFVDKYVLVNDGSTDNTVDESGAKNVIHLDGEGVGAAIDAGHKWMLESMEKPFISVVMAGDGQMDPEDLPNIISKLYDFDHVKGNRFIHSSGVRNMPLIRRVASMTIGFLTSLATGWKWQDPQCGYTGTKLELLLSHPELSEWKGYGYPNWWALCFSQTSENVCEVAVKSVYGEEVSGIRIPRFLPKVSMMLFTGIWRRGWSWYVLGRGRRRANIIVRAVVVSLWFSGWISLMSSAIYPSSIFVPFVVFPIVRYIDRREQLVRTRVSTLFEM
ncbi:MAG: glycosyltransferase family 2 protein [Candidatus Poseidoniaceae archaeon]